MKLGLPDNLLFLVKRWTKSVYNLVARVDSSELQTRNAHLYLYISDGVRHDVVQ